VGSETLRVGYDRALTNSPVADANGEVIRPARRWQRELGAGLDGPWQQTPLTMIGEPRPILEKSDAPIEKDSQNGNGVTVQTERLPREMEELGDNRSRSAPASWRRSVCPTTPPLRSFRPDHCVAHDLR
jgi:hypothetical protein